jgi:hypothetical protein
VRPALTAAQPLDLDQASGLRFAGPADRLRERRALERLRREGGIRRAVTLAEFVEEYLAQHDASPAEDDRLRQRDVDDRDRLPN